ncbi:hypothetical protein L2U69_01640 [Zavarzinia compransoris]|uniref:hypothetical protein n=1 Tax=Zavarzinia marina TaxID=2911065 RepID=UPI001F18477A|nr:hypothetical protein [Zavarzinia marina]MCF4164348.1 hypothetical protein [Zavarzinia marina]
MSTGTATRPVTEPTERPSPGAEARAADAQKRETRLVQAAYGGGAGGATGVVIFADEAAARL